MTLWEYQARLHVWNQRHSDDDGDPVEAPDAAFVAQRAEMLIARGIISGSVH